MTPADSAIAPHRIYLVAGMHRAGTSVVARALQAHGIDLGPRLMSADVRMNARGFFEDLDLVRIDDALLDACGADWKSVALLDEVDWTAPAFAAQATAAAALLAARLAPTGAYGCKDPRIPRLLPFWQRQFASAGVADHYVVAIRHPRSVIASLTARDGLDERRSGWLWLTHLVCALHYSKNRPLVVVDYDRMLAAPQHELARIGSALRIAPTADAIAASALFVDGFLSPELRHAEHAAADLAHVSLPSAVAEAWAVASALARDEASPDQCRTRIETLFADLRQASPLLGYAGSVERVADDVPRLEGELAWARTSLAEATAHAASLAATLDARDRAHAAATTFAVDLQSTVARKDAELREMQAVLDRVRERIMGRVLLRGIERKR